MTWIKNNPIIFVLILLVVIGIIIYFVSRNRVDSTIITIDAPNIFPLQYGSRGDEVQKLQIFLNTNHGCGLLPDGIFGKDTENCVQSILGTTTVDKTTYDKSIIAGLYSNVQGTINETIDNITGFFS